MHGGSRTKIVATIGPASASTAMLTRMMRAGMDVARLNFSHGTHKEHAGLLRNVRAAAKKVGREVAILQDLQGPKIRVGSLPDEGLELKKSQLITFTYSKEQYTGKHIPVTYDRFHIDVKKGHRIFIDDGFVELEAVSVRAKVVKAKVIVPGHIFTHKGMNIPDSSISGPSFTKKDYEDLLFGLNHGVDWVALSFITEVKTVQHVRALIKKHCVAHKLPMPRLMVKIERAEAVDGFLDILDHVDGILLARGDLGIELPYEEVPLIQKEFTEICRAAGKPIIIATHMLESMKDHRRATRAEVSDIANAVLDHADATMLSAETATGEYPYHAVQVMQTVISEAEESRLDDVSFYSIHDIATPALALAQSVHVMAENGQIHAIVTSAEFVELAKKVNVFRPNVPIFIACKHEFEARQLLMKSGVQTFVLHGNAGSFTMRAHAWLKRHKYVTAKQKIAFCLQGAKGDYHLTII